MSVFVFSNDLDTQVLCPVRPSVFEPSPWISVKEGLLKGISDRGRNLSLTGENIPDAHDHFNVLDPGRTAEGAGAAGGAGPELRPFKDLGKIGIEVGFPDQPPHIQGRPEFDRTPARARPALDAEVEVTILNKSLRVDFHRLNISVSHCP